MSNRISKFTHRRIQSIDELLDRLSNVKAYPGGFSADCPARGHQTPEGHLSVKHAGDKALVFCQGGRHGYQDIINGLNLDSLNYMESNKPIPSVSLNDEDAMALLIRTYGLSEATTTHFNITPGKTRQAWQYPVQAGTRYKSYDRKPPNKYCHSEGTPNQLYGFIDVPESTTEIFLVNGEPSVWVCHQANIPAICGLFGEGNLPEDTTSQLEAIGVEVINVVLDLDDAGRKAADKVVSEIKGNFKVRVLQLPVELGEHGDVCDLYMWHGVDNDTFRQALADLPEADVEALWAAGWKGARGLEPLEKRRPSVANQLVELAGDIELFHTPDSTPYAIVEQAGHVETWLLASRTVRYYLARRYYEETGHVPHAQALQDALNVLRGRALFDGREEQVHVRLAACDGKLYLDLCDTAWQAVEIDTAGWRVVSNLPVRFRRSRGMVALPVPQSGGNMGRLRDFLNVSNTDLLLLLGWLVGTFMPNGPYPILVLTGEQGSAKSTGARALRSLVDPSTVPLRSPPRDERDLAITAINSWVVALDNVSNLQPWLSDAICRLATGGGLATRELYTDTEETLLAAVRPVILNGIGDVTARSDLLDRSIIVTLPRIPDDKRRTEAELWAAFERERPQILGALLNAVSCALGKMDTVNLTTVPRMADFAKWAVAAAPALGMNPMDFLNAYTGNRQNIHELELESSQVAAEIVALTGEIPNHEEWAGTATELLEKLNAKVGDTVQRRMDWPKNGRLLSSTLMRLAPNLRAVGVEVERDRNGSKRFIRIRKGTQYCVMFDSSVIPNKDMANRCDADQGIVTQAATQNLPIPTPDQAVSDANDDNDAENHPDSNTDDSCVTILGLPVDKAVEIWRSEGAPLIHLGPGENCLDLEKLLSWPDVSERHLQAVKMWLEKVLT